MLFKLALLNLNRNRKRTLVTLLGITLSLGILVFTEGLFNGVAIQTEKNLIDYQTAHLMIAQPGFDENKDSKPLDYLWSDFGEIRKRIEGLPEVEGVTPRLRFPARLNDGEDELPCLGIGIDLQGTDEKVFRLKKAIVKGRYLKQGEQGILIGDNLAELFEISPGDSITVVVRTRYEAFEALDLEITGIVRTGNPKIDQNMFYLPLSLAQSITEAPNEITELMVRLKPAAEENLPAVEQKIKTLLSARGSKAEVLDWRYLAADFLKAFVIDKIGTAILLSLIVVITAVGITNTMVMVTFERTREIGTLMAMGMRRIRVLRVFLWEGALLGAAGSLAGCAWGGLLTWYYEIHGISMKALYGSMETPYPINDYMYSKLSLRSTGYILMFGIIISILASGLPALRAARQNPAEALRHR